MVATLANAHFQEAAGRCVTGVGHAKLRQALGHEADYVTHNAVGAGGWGVDRRQLLELE